MSKGLKCGACGREFVHPKRLANHEKGCKGDAAKGPPSASAVAAAKRFSESREQRKERERSDKMIDRSADAIEEALVGLRAKRQALLDGIPELQDLNRAIAALEEILPPDEVATP